MKIRYYASKITIVGIVGWGRVRPAIDRLWRFSTDWMVSLLGLAAFFLLLTPEMQSLIDYDGDHKGLFLAIGALIGTILVLAFSLSIIPIQRAVESYTRSIAFVYARDSVAQVIFLSLAALTILPLLFAAGVISVIKDAVLVPLSVLFLSLALDLVRMYYRRICQFLTPEFAIQRLGKLALNYMIKVQKRTRRVAIHLANLQGKDKNDPQILKELQGSIYWGSPQHHQTISGYNGQLAEICKRAIGSNSPDIAKTGLWEMVKICRVYVSCRKDNLLAVPDLQWIFAPIQTDIDSVLDPVYGHLTEMNQKAISTKSEELAVHIIEVISSLADTSFQLDLPHRNILFHTAPGYHIRLCAQTAQRAAYFEPTVAASRKLMELAAKGRKMHDGEHVTLSYVNDWEQTVLMLILHNGGTLVNLALNHLMTLVSIEVNDIEHTHRNAAFLFEKIESMIAIGSKAGVLQGKHLNLPFSMPYDMMKDSSLGHICTRLFERTLGQCKQLTAKDARPLSNFLDIVWLHYRRVAEKADLGNTPLMWYMMNTTRQLLRILFAAFEMEIPTLSDDLRKFEGHVGSLLAFFPYAFHKSNTVSHQYVFDACKLLSWAGLNLQIESEKKPILAALGFSESGLACFRRIREIATSFSTSGVEQSGYELGDLLSCIEYLAIYSTYSGRPELKKKADEYVNEFREKAKEKWSIIEEAYHLRLSQLRDDVEEGEFGRDEEEPLHVLLQYIAAKREPRENK